MALHHWPNSHVVLNGSCSARNGYRLYENEMKNAISRRGSTPIKVFCLPNEHHEIALRAQGVGLSKSAYLRQVGLGFEVKSILDHERITELLKINGDLGRLGGLLKLWLTRPERLEQHFEAKAIADSIEGALSEIFRTQHEIRAVLQTVIKP